MFTFLFYKLATFIMLHRGALMTRIWWAVNYCIYQSDKIRGVSCRMFAKNVSWMAIIYMYCRAADSIFCCAGAAGSPVSDRPAPTDPREHHESLTGEILHQTQRPLTSAVQQWRETFQCVTNTSHWLRWLQFAQVWWPNMLKYLHAFLRCPQIPLTWGSFYIHVLCMAPFWYGFLCMGSLFHVVIPRMNLFKAICDKKNLKKDKWKDFSNTH